MALADALIAIQKAREELRLEESAIASMLDIHWRGEKTDFVALQTIATTITSLMAREPRLDAAALIEIARHNLGSDYIAYLTQLVDLLTPIVDRVLTTLELDPRRCFWRHITWSHQLKKPDQTRHGLGKPSGSVRRMDEALYR